MFEKYHEPLLNVSQFVLRLTKSFTFGVIFISGTLFVGMLGFHLFEKMSWLDSFLNASMLLSGEGPMEKPTSEIGKLFASFYALFSGIIFLLIVGIIFAPLIHRFFHKFHLDSDSKSRKSSK